MNFMVRITETVERVRTVELKLTKKSVVDFYELGRDDDWLDHVQSFIEENWDDLKQTSTGGETPDSEELIDTQIDDVQEA